MNEAIKGLTEHINNINPIKDVFDKSTYKFKMCASQDTSKAQKLAQSAFSVVGDNTSTWFGSLPALAAGLEKCKLFVFEWANHRERQRLNSESKWLSEDLVANRVVPAWRQAGGTMENVNPIGFIEAVHTVYKVQLPWNVKSGDYAIDGGLNSAPPLHMGELQFAVWRAALGKLREFLCKWLDGIAPIRRNSLIDTVSKATTAGQVEVAKMALAEHDENIKKLQQLLQLYDSVDSARQTLLYNMEKHVQHAFTGEQVPDSHQGGPNRRDKLVIDSPAPPAPEEGNSVVDFAKNHPFLTGAAAVLFSEQIKNVARGSAESPIAAGFAALNANEHPVLAGMAIGYLEHEGEKAREMDKRRIVIYAEGVRDRSQKQYEVDALVKKGYEVKKHGYASGGGSGYEWVLEPRW
jgi:hypothetical protein